LIFRYYLKRSEIKLKKLVFSTESKGQYYNLKRTEIISYVRGLPSPQYLALEAKVALSVPIS